MTRTLITNLVLICLAASAIPSTSALTIGLSAAQAVGMLERRQASTCPQEGSSRCKDPKLPSDFCCPSDTTCISLDSSSTSLCCPKGNDCNKIQPVSCDLGFQDVSKNSNAEIMTTRLRDKPLQCGRGTCCPFGYTCNQNSQCLISNATSSTDDVSDTTSSLSPPTPTSTDATEPAAVGKSPICPKFPGVAVAVGFFPGLLAGAIIAFAVLYLLSRRHQDDHRPYSKHSGRSLHKGSGPYNRSLGATGVTTAISGPIPMSQAGTRTDFLRRQPSTMVRSGASRAKSWFSYKTSPTLRDDMDKHQSPLNPVNHWKLNTPQSTIEPKKPTEDDTLNSIPMKYLGKIAPITPPSQVRRYPESTPSREPSTETLKVYSPPGLERTPSRSGFSPPSDTLSESDGRGGGSVGGLKYNLMAKLSPKFNAANKGNKSGSSNAVDSTATGTYNISPPSPLSRPCSPTLPANPAARRPYPNNNDATYLPPTQYQSNPSTTAAATTTPNQRHKYPYHHAPPIPYQHYQQQPQQQQPAPSRPQTHMTTFTDVLRDAGLERAEPTPEPAVPMIPKGLGWKTNASGSTLNTSGSSSGGGGGGVKKYKSKRDKARKKKQNGIEAGGGGGSMTTAGPWYGGAGARAGNENQAREARRGFF